MNARLIFVYNANAGLLAGVMDSVHKTVSPSTYACDLCSLTHGVLTMRPQWRRYLQSLSIPTDFYHRPDFWVAFPTYANMQLPLIGLLADGQMTIVMDRDRLAKIDSADDLASALQAELAAVAPELINPATSST